MRESRSPRAVGVELRRRQRLDPLVEPARGLAPAPAARGRARRRRSNSGRPDGRSRRTAPRRSSPSSDRIGRPLGRAGDQITGRGHEPDPEQRPSARRAATRQRKPAPRRRRQPCESAQRSRSRRPPTGDFGHDAVRRRAGRPGRRGARARVGARSASTVRPARSRRRAAETIATLPGPGRRSARRGSRSGASRRNARARPIRRRSPGESGRAPSPTSVVVAVGQCP